MKLLQVYQTHCQSIILLAH